MKSHHPGVDATIRVSHQKDNCAVVVSGRLSSGKHEEHTFTVGDEPGMVRYVCLWETGGWRTPDNPATRTMLRTFVYDIKLFDTTGGELVSLPAGGGWIEGTMGTHKAGFPASPNWCPEYARLEPVWSHTELAELLEGTGIVLCEGKTRWPLWTIRDNADLANPYMKPPPIGPVTVHPGGVFTARPAKKDNGFVVDVWVLVALVLVFAAVGVIAMRAQ